MPRRTEGVGGIQCAVGRAVRYLQGESDDFETLLHGVKLLLVAGVAHNVGPQFNVLVTQIPARHTGSTRGLDWEITMSLNLNSTLECFFFPSSFFVPLGKARVFCSCAFELLWRFAVRQLVVGQLLPVGQASVDVVEDVEVLLPPVETYKRHQYQLTSIQLFIHIIILI